jgi:multidrug efflux pump subunit AcrB
MTFASSTHQHRPRSGEAPRDKRAGAQRGTKQMWIVRFALHRPYTFVVLSMLIALMGILTIERMPTDIFPEINIPVVAAIWTYNGLEPREMEGRITSQFERAATTTVSGIEHTESQTLSGVSVIKVFSSRGRRSTAPLLR